MVVATALEGNKLLFRLLLVAFELLLLLLLLLVWLFVVVIEVVLQVDDNREFWRDDELEFEGVCTADEGNSELLFVLVTIVLLVSLLSSDRAVPFVLAAILAEVREPGDDLVVVDVVALLDILEERLTIVLCGLMLSKLPFINSSNLS